MLSLVAIICCAARAHRYLAARGISSSPAEPTALPSSVMVSWVVPTHVPALTASATA